jgi:cytoskeletal protein RodZ
MFELGNSLREARQRRRIDLVAAEQDTKIRSKYLAALETEDFDVLPGPVFVRGFLRTYSRYLGLDPQLYVDEYNARFGRFEDVEEHDGPVLGRPGLAHERERRGRRTMRVLVVGTVVALALLAWLGLRDAGDGSSPTVGGEHDRATQPLDAASDRAGAATSGSLDTAARTARGTSRPSHGGGASAKGAGRASTKGAATTSGGTEG